MVYFLQIVPSYGRDSKKHVLLSMKHKCELTSTKKYSDNVKFETRDFKFFQNAIFITVNHDTRQVLHAELVSTCYL